MTLRKQYRESDLEIKHYIDRYSNTLCLAKWYNATIWLGSGMTTSCHHPLPHFVHLVIFLNIYLNSVLFLFYKVFKINIPLKDFLINFTLN